MAHWTDGPEYAPTERPDVFVEPDDSVGLGPLPEVDQRDRGPDPVQPPPLDFTAPDAPPLDALVPPPSAPERDPAEAFDVASTPMTAWSSTPPPPPEGDHTQLPHFPPPTGAPLAPGSEGGSAWAHAHAPRGVEHSQGQPPWQPNQPFQPGPHPASSHVPGHSPGWPPPQVNPGGFPEPGPPPWQQPAPQREFEPVTFGSMLRNATPGVLICLALGAIIPPFSLALLVLGSVLAARIRYRRRIIGRSFSGAIVGSILLGILTMTAIQGYFDPLGWYDAVTAWAQVACVVLVIAVPLIVGDAMRRGERPEDLW